VQVSFVEHNRGANYRSVTLNYEVWLMLLGTNIDYWSDLHINKIIGEFGHVIAWEEDPNNIARVLVKARVVNLEEIPWFIVITEGPGFNGESWTIQTEIIQANMLGALSADEDFPPDPDDLQPEMFDFFWLWIARPWQQGPFNPQQQEGQPVEEGQEGGWGLWPQGPANAQANQPNQQVILDIPVQLAQQPLGFDLNEPLQPLDDDLGVVENVFQVLNAPQ
jgi:hypothetical protein